MTFLPIYRRNDNMKSQKINNYNLTGSIHTLQIKSADIPEIPAELQECISSSTRKNHGKIEAISIINPNKLLGDCFSFTEFEQSFSSILKECGVGAYSLMRVDLRLDNYDSEHYRLYAKLHKYLLSCLAVTYKVRNVYKTQNLFTNQLLSMAIKNEYIQCECYNREEKSKLTENHEEKAKSRLEERTMPKSWRMIASKKFENNMESNLEDMRREFVRSWSDRWQKSIATANIEAVWSKYNGELAKIYQEDKAAYPVKFRSLTDFLIQYQDCIFCHRQLVELLELIGVDNAESRARNHKKRYGIEYFSKSDLKKAVEEIKRATEKFFSE